MAGSHETFPGISWETGLCCTGFTLAQADVGARLLMDICSGTHSHSQAATVGSGSVYLHLGQIWYGLQEAAICGVKESFLGELFRTDAKCEKGRISLRMALE